MSDTSSSSEEKQKKTKEKHSKSKDAKKAKPKKSDKKADSTNKPKEDKGKRREAKQEFEAPTSFVPLQQLNWGEEPEEVMLQKQKQCILLLIEARLLLGNMVKYRYTKETEALERRRALEREEKKQKGKLTVTEIQEVLRSQPDDDDFDWLTEIQDVKKNLAIEIRRNHVLDRDLQKLDKRIGLLIKNRNALNVYLEQEKKKKKKKKGEEEEEPVFDLLKDPRKLEFYQELFYLLQTEPKYLAKCVYLISPELMDTFLETTILTLYGDAFSPREEFLTLQLFKLSIKNEIAKIKSLSDFLKLNTVVPKMVITYNRRKQGLQYLKKTLGPILKTVMEKSDLSLELNPLMIYQTMINEMEIRTGEKTTLERNIPEEKAMANPQVKKIMKQRIDNLQEICQLFLDGVINSMGNLPYGIRWICKTIKSISEERFGEALDADQVLKVTGYFVYYRFINLAIVTPDAYNVVEGDLGAVVRKNLVVVAKVLQNLFNFRNFGPTEAHMQPLNAWIDKHKPIVAHYFNSLVEVDEPEDHLEVTKYNELTQKTKPVVLISIHEIFATHKLLVENLDQLAPEESDELRVILKDLGDVPPEIEPDSPHNREIQLTLINRFKVDVEDGDEIERLYGETKELIIPVLRAIPIETSIHRLHLTDVLESGIRHASDTKNKALFGQINQILENISKLEEAGKVSKSDRYQSFVHDIALEVANRNAIREQQKKEIARLKATLESLREHQKYVNEQISQYQEYLRNAREMHYQGSVPGKKKKRKRKKKKKDDTILAGPFKFSYKDLAKMGVIVDSEVPKHLRKKTQFVISSEEHGVFDIVAKVAAVSVEKMQLELDDLLERHYNGTEFLELDNPQVTLDVNMTIYLINKNFMGTK